MKRNKKVPALLYFFLLILLVWFLMLHAFSVTPMQTGTFTRFLISLLVVVLLLPSVSRVKIFGLAEATRKTVMFEEKK